MDPNAQRSESPTAASLQSLSPERPDLSSGKTGRRRTRKRKSRSASSTSTSLQSQSLYSPDLASAKQPERNEISAQPQLPKAFKGKSEDDVTLSASMKDWKTEHVKHWLITELRIPTNVAQSLYEKETTGTCLVSFEKQDLTELGVPPAQALLIVRQVERFNRHSQPSAKADDHLETQTVSTESGFHSESLPVQQKQTEAFKENMSESFQKLMSAMRPFDKSNVPIVYTEHNFLPNVTGPDNPLEPVHEYKLLLDSQDVSETEVLFEFSNELLCFAASCMNSRTNGTIHFGVKEDGQIMGHRISSKSLYSEAFQSNMSKYFDHQHITSARMCIRPPVFIQVQRENGTMSEKHVIEVDVVPSYSQTQENVFFTTFTFPFTETQDSKTVVLWLFVREGSRKVNILSNSNPRVLHEVIKQMNEKVKLWASARKTAEERYEPPPSGENQGQRLKQLITRGQDTLSNSIQVIVVTDKCHSSQLEHMNFLKEVNLFAVLDFDPESAKDGTCHFYRKDRAANLHFPHMFSTQDSSSVIAKLNLFKQTSWIFCNGQAGEEGDLERPLSPSEWLKKRSGDIINMVSFLCSPEVHEKHRLMVLIILHSAVTDISSPILETFCALYRSLGGMDNMLCLCKDTTVFSHWRDLVEMRCKENITNKCIHTLSFHEISSTIKILKDPQTRASRRFLPSTGSSSVLLEKKDEEMMTDLEILCENECENTEIETNHSFEEFKKKTEEDFYRGGRVSWWNFYLCEQPGSLPFIKRNKYDELLKLICPDQGHTSPCVIVSLFHRPGCGGTTLAMHILWSLKNKFRCAVVKSQTRTNKEIALQVRKLLTYGKQESGFTPVLLLTDNWYDILDLKQCIIDASSDRSQTNMVIILNCERTPFPAKASRHCKNPNVFIGAELSVKEKDLFYNKYEELKRSHDKPDTFYTFMIMRNDFSEEYVSDLVNNILKDLDVGSKQGRLLGFLALLNTYEPDSYMSLSLCEELMEIDNAVLKQVTLEDEMNPYSTLLITFTVEKHGVYKAVRLLHQMIAENCLKVFKLSDLVIDMLNCDKLYKTCMGKDSLTEFIKSMLITRRDQGDEKITQFSPLIENIQFEGGSDKVTEVFEKAIIRYDRKATLSQALSRHMSIIVKDFDSALKWALDALSKRRNSHMADTVGRVHKTHLTKVIKESKEQSPESLNECLHLATKAVSAFKKSQELAVEDEPYFKSGQNDYYMPGYLGETAVMMLILKWITELPIFTSCDRFGRNKMLHVLSGQCPVSSLYVDHDPRMNAFVNVLKEHERFLVSLKNKLKTNFAYFDNYLLLIDLAPRHVPINKKTFDDQNKQQIMSFFNRYIKLFTCSDQEQLSERERNPTITSRRDLEMMQADSFAGILQSLRYKDPKDIEKILEKWKIIFEHSLIKFAPTSDIVNYILANIVVHVVNPKSGLLMKYEELVTILNDTLQSEGARSDMPELYYLCMLLMWPSKDQTLKLFTEYSHISAYIGAAERSFRKSCRFTFPSRSASAHFFLGKESGLKRIVSKSTLDQMLQSRSSEEIRNLWQTGQVWSESSIQEKLLRVKGRSENGEIYVTYGTNTKIIVHPPHVGDICSGYSCEEVSFYIGFTLEGPVAYGLKYEM